MDFTTFRAKFKGDIVTPHDPDYEQAIDRWAANAKRRAAVVAFVKDEHDVSLAIKYARAAGLRIAVRGGGHSPAGTSSSEGGLVIDLSKYLNGVRVDPDKKLVHVQGGAMWGAVDEEAIKFGLAAVAGTVNDAGVGGLAVGGGYGWLSGAHGLVIDNTIQHTVVTADGNVLIANETSNPDLFWGVRGGGSNFGVVTEFIFKLHPQRRTIYAGALVFPIEKCTAISEFIDDWWSKAKENEGIMLVILRPLDGPPSIMTVLFYNGSEVEGRKVYKGLLDLEPLVDQTKEIPYETLNTLNNPLTKWGLGYYFKGVLLAPKPSDDFNPEKVKQILDLANSKDHLVAVLLELLPHKRINSVPASATPYRRDLPGNSLVFSQWVEDTPEMNLRAKEICHAIADLMPKGEGYGNYTPDCDAFPVPGALPSDKSKALFGDAYPKLQSVKKKYDPDMIFNQWYTIIPT